jgi:hypothetical protein
MNLAISPFCHLATSLPRYLAISLLFSSLHLSAQVSSDAAVRLTATIDSTVPSITINWPADATATGYTVYKKAKSETSWTEVFGPLAGTDSSFTDLNVMADSSYEYGVDKSLPALMAFGYINAGWNLRTAGYRGRLILLVDSTLADSLSTEILRLMRDISGDGWSVARHDVSPMDSVPDVRAIVVDEYNAAPTEVKALLILGHVPVPYSGDLNPDGHPDHKGAWPADIYYADVNGNFTDQYINNPTASRPENWNVPGDGKFDQSVVPSPVELKTGRVDLSNLPAFGMSEIALMRRYLDKDHAFRIKLITALPRALISDNFGFFSGEAFAADGWRNFSPLLGTNSMAELPYFTTLATESYLWSYGCGGGWYQGAGGVGTTADYAADTVQTIFSMMFGSYFGDWDNSDNFLRAPLASADRALTNCWAGRPFWQFHHMALGETVGYGAQLAQNNQVTYQYNYGRRFVHIALMGDPTLRMHIIAPVTDVSATSFGSGVNVIWQPSSDTVIGYHVYRSDELFGRYDRLTLQPVATLTYTDHQPAEGMNYYMVRAVKLENTPSGSYFNQSTGITDSVNFIVGMSSPAPVSGFDFRISPNPTATLFRVTFISELPQTFSLTVLDLMGKTLYQRDYTLPPVQNSVMIDPSTLLNGVYLVIVKSGERKIVKRLQIVR